MDLTLAAVGSDPSWGLLCAALSLALHHGPLAVSGCLLSFLPLAFLGAHQYLAWETHTQSIIPWQLSTPLQCALGFLFNLH